MLMTYQEYKKLGGTLSEAEFNQLVNGVYSLFDNYIKELIPYWKIKSLNDYGLDLDMAIANQIDFIALCGGKKALMGMSDFSIKSVNTNVFNFSVENDIEMYHGVPFNPFSLSQLISELRKARLLSKAL